MPLPTLFIVLASFAALAAMVALWSSLRAALGGAANGEVLASSDEPEGHAALRDEKKSLLRAMKDLEYEHTVGKISDDDFQRLDAAYRVRAKEVLSLLDRDFAPYRSRAEALIAEAASGVKVEAKAEAKAEAKPEAKAEPKADDEALRRRAKELREEAERLEKQLAEAEPAAETETATESKSETATETETAIESEVKS